MTLDQFIRKNNIRITDSIVMKKKLFGMVDHYVLYAGIKNGEHKFIANYTKGINYIPRNELNEFLKVLVPIKIEKFTGNDFDRESAKKRMFSRLGEKAYGLFSNNCEHFKNYVHSGTSRSDQVKDAGKQVAVVGGIAVGVMLLDSLLDMIFED